jgi:folylpolyglutamate synthase/dihydropteroate synthase
MVSEIRRLRRLRQAQHIPIDDAHNPDLIEETQPFEESKING